MKFTEAALLGSTLIKPCQNSTIEADGSGCYVGMALVAMGLRTGDDQQNYALLKGAWPWLAEKIDCDEALEKIYECYDDEGFDAAHALAQKLEEQYDVPAKQEVPGRECQLVQK